MSLDAFALDLLGLTEPASVKVARSRPVETAGGGYDGAKSLSGNLVMWTPTSASADADIIPDKAMADSRVRDMAHNDAYVAEGVHIHQNSIVGSLYILNAKPNYRVLGLDSTWQEEFADEVESLFSLYAESTDKWIDASRHDTLTELLRLAVGVYCLTGEVLASVEWIRESLRPYRTAIQMIDVDRLSNPRDLPATTALRGGIQRDARGAAIGYHVRMTHPNDLPFFSPDRYEWKYVPARKPWGRLQMLHFFERSRPDQTRGISDLTAALKELRTTKTFRDVTLQNAVVNATFAAAIESELPSEVVFSQLGGGVSSSALQDYASAYLAQVAEYAGGAKALHLDGARIPHLYPGTKLNLLPAKASGGVGENFEKSLLRYLAATLGVSYEELSKDYSQSSYIASRAAMNQTAKRMRAEKKIIADAMATAIYKLWLEEAINSGRITSLPRNAPSWYEGLNADAYVACNWIGASFGQTDELKETQAAQQRIAAKLSTYEIEVARLHGRDYREILRQSAKEKRDFEREGLEVPTMAVVGGKSGSGSPRKTRTTNQEAPSE